MPRTPDSFAGESLEEGTIYDNRPAGEEPTESGGVRFVDGSFSLRDSVGLYNPRSTSVHPVHLDTIPPTSADDNTLGYVPGHHWLDTVTLRVYQALDVTLGAAIWERIDNLLYNVAAVTDPQATDDSTLGYEIGSIWFNTLVEESYICLDATASAAIWQLLPNTTASAGIGKDSPREIFYGNSLIDYGGAAGVTSGEIQYTRIWLTIDTIIEGGAFFVDSGGLAARKVRVGLYSQADPRDFTLTPATKLRETAETSTANLDGTFVRPLWSGGDYTIPATGYYWIAVIQDSSAMKYATTPDVFRANFLPVRRESGTGTTLPATPSGLSNPVSALIWAAVVEKA